MGQGGPWDQNFQLFVGPHLGSKMLNFELYELKTLYFPGFWPKIAPQEAKNGLFLAKMGVDKSAFFSKTPSLNCLKMHHNKVLGSILIWDAMGFDAILGLNFLKLSLE